MNFANTYKLVAGQTSPEDVLLAADYPASGSYIDVTGYPWVNVIVHLGAIHGSDLPVFTLKCSDATNGTADDIDATYAAHTCAADDDDEFVTLAVEVAKLPTDHHFVTCTVSAVTNGSYGDIVFFLGPALTQPVTQSSSLPSASQHELAG